MAAVHLGYTAADLNISKINKKDYIVPKQGDAKQSLLDCCITTRNKYFTP